MQITHTETDPLKIKKILRNSKIVLILLPFISLFSLLMTGMEGFIFDIVFYIILVFIVIYTKKILGMNIALGLCILNLIFMIISISVGTAPFVAILFPIIAIDRVLKIRKYKFKIINY